MLERLKSPRKSGGGYVARCPAHDDAHASLSIAAGNSVPVVLSCKAGCEFDAITAALGFAKGELSRDKEPEKPHTLTRAAVYTYRNQDGSLFAKKERLIDESGRKTFAWWRRNPDEASPKKWISGTDGYIPLYRLPELCGAVQEQLVVVCYSDDTEVLTSRGWVAFPDLADDDLLGQYDPIDAMIEFVVPSGRQSFQFSGELVNIKTDWCDLAVTPDHRMLVRQHKCHAKVIPAEQVKSSTSVPTAGLSKGVPSGMTLAQVRLLVAFAADASVDSRGYSIRWTMKKARKQNRLIGLLDEIGIPFKERPSSRGGNETTIFVNRHDAPFLLQVFPEKMWTNDVMRWALEERIEALSELPEWDGTRYGKSIKFETTRKAEADAISATAAISGFSCIVTPEDRDGRKRIYHLSLIEKTWRVIGSNPRKSRWASGRIPYTGTVYCATVPSSFMVVRRNGRTTISGNCEGEKDVDRLASLGFVVTTTPNGAASKWREDDSQYFAARRVCVIADDDEPGRKMAERFVAALKPVAKSVGFVVMPNPDGIKGFDASDFLEYGGAVAELTRIVESFDKPQVPPEVVSSADLKARVLKLWEEGDHPGVFPGWDVLREFYRPRLGELTVITGAPGSGKSSFLDDMMVRISMGDQSFLGEVNAGWRWLIYSPENFPPQRHVSQLIRKYVSKPFNRGPNPRMSQEEIIHVWPMIESHFVVLDPSFAGCTLDRILEVAKTMNALHRFQGLVLDPYNVIAATSRSKAQSEHDFVNEALQKIKLFAHSENVHVMMVAHPTKLKRESADSDYPIPRPWDISGCHSGDTEVLTSRGWVAHSEVTTSDNVACFDLKSSTIEYLNPSRTWEYDHDGEMHSITGDSFGCLVTPNHKMVVAPYWRRDKPLNPDGRMRRQKFASEGWSLIEAKDCAESQMVVPIAAKLRETKSRPAPTEIEGMPTDEALMFLGWWIAEGYTSMGGLAICQAFGDMSNRFSETMKKAGLKFTEAVRDYRRPTKDGFERPMWVARLLRRKHARLCDWVMEHCGVGAANKKIPSLIFTLPDREKRIFLEALIDGDGSRSYGGSSRYSTTSKRLADEVMWLAIELGHHASVASTPGAKIHHKTRYSVAIGRKERITSSLRKSRHMSTVHYAGKVYCLTVPTGAYVTRRNGEMMISGNSASWFNHPDAIISLWRSMIDEERKYLGEVEIHIQKIRFQPECGSLGMARLYFDRVTSRFLELPREGVVRVQEPATERRDKTWFAKKNR